MAAGRLDRVLQKQLTLGTEVLLPVVRLEDSFVHLVPRHLVSYAEFARKDNWAGYNRRFDLPQSTDTLDCKLSLTVYTSLVLNKTAIL